MRHGWLCVVLVGCSEYTLNGFTPPTLVDDLFDELLDEPLPPAEAPIYLNEPDALWAWYPEDDELIPIGTFSIAQMEGMTDGMTDIAISQSGKMIGCTAGALYAINPETAETFWITDFPEGVGFVGLTFIDGDILIGGSVGLNEIDPRSGAVVGVLDSTARFVTSGDVVGLPDGNLYWVITHNGSDELVTYNPETRRVESTTSTGTTEMYGIGYADETLYGFTNRGESLPLLGETDARTYLGAKQWWGATTNPVRWD